VRRGQDHPRQRDPEDPGRAKPQVSRTSPTGRPWQCDRAIRAKNRPEGKETKVKFVLILGAALFLSANAQADCVCRCVNGEMQAICSNSLALPPICPPRICPLTPPAIEPLPSLRIPPIGTSECRPAQVLNPRTGQYEWREICR
jgi:hypothetical protein